MLATVKRITPDWLMQRACEMTMHGQKSKIKLASLAKCEHSPLRTVMYWVEMLEIPTFVSVHLVRHKIGVEHFVKSMRNDLYIDDTVTVDRNTPVNHGMFVNAHAMIAMSRKRLCYKSHVRTVASVRKVVKAINRVDPEMEPYLVPECVYRNGYCPELRECKPGLAKVLRAYKREDLIAVGK